MYFCSLYIFIGKENSGFEADNYGLTIHLGYLWYNSPLQIFWLNSYSYVWLLLHVKYWSNISLLVIFCSVLKTPRGQEQKNKFNETANQKSPRREQSKVIADDVILSNTDVIVSQYSYVELTMLTSSRSICFMKRMIDSWKYVHTRHWIFSSS